VLETANLFVTGSNDQVIVIFPIMAHSVISEQFPSLILWCWGMGEGTRVSLHALQIGIS
jgi:hypothetical protein